MVQFIKLLICLALFLALGYFGLHANLPGPLNSFSISTVEKKLSNKIRLALVKSGQHEWAQVSLEGQKATITGTPPNNEAKLAAISAIENATGSGLIMGGITVLDTAQLPSFEETKIAAAPTSAPSSNQSNTQNTPQETPVKNVATTSARLPIESPYRFRADYQGNFIRIAEAMPNEEFQARIGRYIEQTFQGRLYIDNTRLASGQPEQWEDMLEASLFSLSTLDKGVFYSEDYEVKISGIAKDLETANLAVERARLLPDAYSVTTDFDANGEKINVTIDATRKVTIPQTTIPDDVDNGQEAKRPSTENISNSNPSPTSIDPLNRSVPAPPPEELTPRREGINVPSPSDILDADKLKNLEFEETDKGLPLAPEPITPPKIRTGQATPDTRQSPTPRIKTSALKAPAVVSDIKVAGADKIKIQNASYLQEPTDTENVQSLNKRTCKNEIAFLVNANSVKFFSGSARLTPSSRPTLATLADVMKRCSEFTYEITGHTDNTGEAEENLVLSRERAEAVKLYLASRRVDSKNLLSKGFGSTEPIADNTSLIGRERNRRVDINILETERK